MLLLRKEILIIAYACEPNKSSEPGVGWNFVRVLSSEFKITVITRKNNKANIEGVGLKGVEFIYVDLSKGYQWLKKRLPFGLQLYSTLWQCIVYRRLPHLTDLSRFALIHHLTFAVSKNIPRITRIDQPYIFGPMGGGDSIPNSFLIRMGFSAIATEIIYRLIHLYSYRVSYSTKSLVANADALVFRSRSTQERFPVIDTNRNYLISETAYDFKDKKKQLATKQFDEAGLKVICVGRLMKAKGFEYAIRSFAEFIDRGGRGLLTIVGDGAEKTFLERLTRRLKIDSLVDFTGFIPNKDVIQKLKKSHVLVHPSFREGGSWTIMEAMYFGNPVICFDTSGPRDMVTKDTGILVGMTNPTLAVKEFATALDILYKNQSLYHSMSMASHLRIKEEYNWNKRKSQIVRVYKDVLADVEYEK